MGLEQDSKVKRKRRQDSGLGEMMTLSFRLLLDMHKCQSDYNAQPAEHSSCPPAMCLSFCHMAQCIQHPKKKGQRQDTRAASCECDNAHSFTHSLLTRPSSTTRRNRTKERLLEMLLEQATKEKLPLAHRPSSSLPVRRCAYCRSVALRLRTSRKSRQQIKAKWRRDPCPGMLPLALP